jgi:hypothetical protein
MSIGCKWSAEVPGGVSWEDERGVWREELDVGSDRPDTEVDD